MRLQQEEGLNKTYRKVSRQFKMQVLVVVFIRIFYFISISILLVEACAWHILGRIKGDKSGLSHAGIRMQCSEEDCVCVFVRVCACERGRERDYSLTNYLVKCCSFHLKHSNATIPINKHYSKQKAARARPGTLCSSCLVNSGRHGWMILFHFYQWAFQMWVFIFCYLLQGEKIPHKSTQLFSKISVYSDIFVQGGIRDSTCLQYNSGVPLLPVLIDFRLIMGMI